MKAKYIIKNVLIIFLLLYFVGAVSADTVKYQDSEEDCNASDYTEPKGHITSATTNSYSGDCAVEAKLDCNGGSCYDNSIKEYSEPKDWKKLSMMINLDSTTGDDIGVGYLNGPKWNLDRETTGNLHSPCGNTGSPTPSGWNYYEVVNNLDGTITWTVRENGPSGNIWGTGRCNFDYSPVTGQELGFTTYSYNNWNGQYRVDDWKIYSETPSVSDPESYIEQGNGFVMGRPIRTRFNYTTTRKAQVAFAVDETYSMSGPMNGVKNNIKWFFRELGDSAEGTVIGSGCGNSWRADCSDSRHPNGAMNPGEPRDLASGTGLVSNEEELVDAASRLTERTYFEGPDSTVAEALNYGSEASDYTGNIGYYGDEYYEWDPSSPKAIIWVQSGRSGYGSCSSISDFSSGMGKYMEDNGFRFYAIVRGLSECRDNFEVAASRTGGKVYTLSNNPSNSDWQDILGEISQSVETRINLTAVVDSPSYSAESYDDTVFASGDQEYNFNNINTEKGENSFVFDWRPISYGLMDVKTGNSFITLDDGGERVKYNFSGSRQEEVGYVDFKVNETSILRRGGTVEVNFTVTNLGNADSLERVVWLADGTNPDSNRFPRVVPTLSPGESGSYSLQVNEGHPVFNDPEPLYIRVDPGSGTNFWDNVEEFGKGGALEPDEDNNVVELGYPPKLENIEPFPTNGVSWGESFSPAFTYAHPSPGQIRGSYNYTNSTAVASKQEDLPININQGSNQFVLSTQNVYFPDLAETWHNFTVRIEDDKGAATVSNASYYISNPEPEVIPVNPQDGSPIYAFPVNLRVQVNDENSEYYNRQLEIALKNDTGTPLATGFISPGETFAYTWQPSDNRPKDYEWRVEVEDKWGEYEENFSFTRSIDEPFRARTTIDLNYSSLVMNAGSNKYAELALTNPLDERKNLTIMLSGIEAEFLDGSTTKNLPNFEPDSQERFTLRLTSNEPGKGNVTATIRNNDIGIETKETMQVTVLENYRQTQRDVPGIGLVQILFLTVFSTVLYFVRL